MAKIRTTKQRIEDELNRNMAQAQAGRVPALRTTLQNYTPVSVAAVKTQSIEKTEPTYSHGGGGARRTPEAQKDRENRFIAEYESIPDYNVLERAADSIGRTASKIFNPGGGRGSESKSEKYAQKSEMTERYHSLMNKRTQQALEDYQAAGGDKLPVLAGVNASEILHPFQYANARKEIEPLLAQYGVTFEQLEDYYRTQALADQNKQMAEYAKEHPILASGASVVTNALSGIENTVGGLTNYLEGKPLNSKQALAEYSKLTPTIRGTVKEGIGNPVGQTLYDVETSIGDMLFSLALGGGNSAASLGIMATNAGGNTLNEQMDKNTDPWQKVATAAASGAIEAITEKLPLDNLFKMVNNPAGRQTAKELIMNVLKQAGTEAGEEAISEIANTFVDGIVNGSQSDYNQSIQAYMAQGMTEEQARLKAETDIAQNAAYSALVGGLSGGVMGGGATAINNVNVDANNRAQVAGLRMDAMSDARAYDRAKTAQNNAINARIDALRGFDYNYNQNAEDDFEAQQSAQLAQMLEQGRRLAQPQSDEEFQAGLNKQLAEALAQNQAQQEVAQIENAEQQTAPVEQQAAQTEQTERTSTLTNPADIYLDNDESIPTMDKKNRVREMAEDIGLNNKTDSRIPSVDSYEKKIMDSIKNRANKFLEEAVKNKGKTKENYNQIVLSDVPANVVNMVKQASGNKLDISNKRFGIEGGKLYHEIIRHSDPKTEMSRDQIALNPSDISNLIDTMYNPDIIENVSNGLRGTQRKNFAMIKKAEGYIVLVEAVGGKKNPNIVPECILHLSDNKMKRFLSGELSIADIIYENMEREGNVEGNSEDIKNRVTVAHDAKAENSPPAYTSETFLRSPLFDSSVNQTDQNVNGKTQTVGNGEKIIRNADGSETLIFNPYADEPNSTQTSRNSMYRYFDDMPDVQKLIEEQRKEGKFDKEVHTNKETLEKAEAALNQDEEAVKQNLLSKEYIDEVDTAESLMLARKMFTEGNMEEGSRFLQNLSYKASTPGRVLQMLGAMAGTGEGAIVKANALIKEETDNFFKRSGNKSKKERCGKLATALKNIGNDHTNDPAQRGPKTYDQIKQGVVNELEKESTSVFNGFSDTDVDYLARMVERGVTTDEIQYKLEERLATGSWDISNEDLQFVLDKFNEANKHDINSKQAAELQMEAYQKLAEYLPDSSFMEKWNNWRYLAMLGNPRTHIRNLVGNFMFGNIVSSVSDEIGGALEATANNTAKFFGGKGFERTKTAALKDNNLVKASQKYGEDHAWAQLADVKNKYSDMKRDIASEKRIFKNRVLEGYRKSSGNLLTKSDELSLMNKYKRAMAGYLQANGKDASIFNSKNSADQAMIERASDYAVRRAKEATFHEDNKIAEILTNVSNYTKNQGGIAGNVAYGLIEGIIPFKKTPLNILKQATEYSPANVVNMVENAIQKDPARFIENLSKTMTGSAIMMLGYILASKGLLRARGNEKEADLDKLTGEQDFSLNIGNDSYTLDWAAPAALPLFIGARLYENNEYNDNLTALDALASIGDPMIEMSMLQGINNTLESTRSYDKSKNTMAEFFTNLGYNYVSQSVPTVAGQIARSVDDTRRTTYTGKTGIADTVGKLINKTKNKIPGLSQKSQPYVDAWGETQKNAGGNLAGRLFNNMIAPWYYSNTEKTDTEKELYRLNQEANANIVPKTAETSYDGKKLNPEEYTEYATIKGQDAQRILGETIDNPRYAGLDDTAKAELLSDMLLFSNALAKNEMFGYDISGSNTYKKKYEAYERGGVDGLIDYITLKESLNGQTSDSATIAALEAQEGLTDADKVFYFKQGKKEYSKEAQYLEGINEKYAYDWYKIQTENGKKKDDMIYGIYTSDLPEEEKNAMLEVLGMDPDELIYELTVGK